MLAILILNSVMFCLMNHPLSLGMIMLIQTILISIITGKLVYNFWYSYIIFMIMIGGLLVLFMYMTSIASNEKFKFSSKIMNLAAIITPLLCLSFSLLDPLNISLKFKLNEMNQIKSMNQFMSLSKYLNYPHFMIYLMMVIYLLVTLIAIVKIMSQSKSMLRQKF
uniref:NADH-ubiquinone oxidoreductase chain 6 n=1 Tax=Stylosomus ilicicola TaxID=1425628 RepID=A0A3G1GRF9_9CUCU|nr:NADH dehydrogenase subunit 6 [Stylosomus ilicicola]